MHTHGFEQYPLSMLAVSSQIAENSEQYLLRMLIHHCSVSSQIAETAFSVSSQINVYRYSHRQSLSAIYLSSKLVSPDRVLTLNSNQANLEILL